MEVLLRGGLTLGYFPMCVELERRRVLCVGEGPQIADKLARLKPFCGAVELLPALSEADLEPRPVLVIVGGLARAEAAAAAALCTRRAIPVNVVDMPELCTFIFPALITRGALTISITTAGQSPALAARLRRRIERQIPARMDDVLSWLAELRRGIREQYPYAQRAELLGRAADMALELGRPLTEAEWQGVIAELDGAQCEASPPADGPRPADRT